MHPLVYYKPGMTLDTPVDINMPAADWITFLMWLSIKNTQGVEHIVYGNLAKQIMDKCYDQSSVKAAMALVHKRENQPPQELLNFLKATGMRIVDPNQIPDPEDFGSTEGNEE